MKADSKVSVIMVNWNCTADTIECLDSVYRMDYPNIQVILVDNGSIDGSLQEIRERFRDVVLIENKDNLGFCVANNQAIKIALESQTDYLLILNNDTSVEPSLIKELKEVVDSNSHIGAVSPVIPFYHNRDLIYFQGTKIDWANGDFFGQYTSQYVQEARGVIDIDFPGFCATFMKREVMERVGFLDEQFFAYYEDTDWGKRCWDLGFRVVLLPKKLVYHKGSGSTGGNLSSLVYYYLFRNRLFFMRKHAGFLRKLQFANCYIRDSYRQYDSLLSHGAAEKAKAVLDGFWSSVQGRVKDKRMAMPEKFKTSRDFLTIAYLIFLSLKAVFKR